ncbi:winged helix-turn-helix transcriptional regulator [Terriglobus albidus]|uniref:Winged helix-turn-helix transcriptional regulator n=1 Tax=Terriglobus albidus TaxID=1592106 RepID=A0A5B9EFI7_9BACT|nr:MarR family winged helix-turn-helix transcriptional regulator [Terriglobus albidus]QEE30559.1 winged helix-turn-helix transcriptional regulator [Terriglobus albidus]
MKPPPYELCYCHAAKGSARLLSRIYDRHLSSVGINIQQLTILSMILHNPGMLMANLADQMIMERTTLVRALKPLQEAGFIASELAGTGRTLSFGITRTGKEKVLAARPHWQAAQHEIETKVGVKQAEALRDAMHNAASSA